MTIARDTHATIAELMEMVFSVWYMQRLIRRPAGQAREPAVRQTSSELEVSAS
jgi:hypothetical protein